ncbi:phage antirepressor KilAC domain-containing protein [uncultured Olegusella sp.]|uniref:phage antirepressor KilAC domain-containing protein n=1 Tax=uncultured Olegusella sp. TaxID=1979846 RepID=UPI00262ADFBA|nr:phage antirepressor KilAC domain-containing protein [uncultured Olegusella sp.]
MEIIPQVFSNSEFGDIRVIKGDGGEPLFIANDICKFFGVMNKNRVLQQLDDDEKGGTQIETPGGKQTMTHLTEAGLYHFLFIIQPSKARGIPQEEIDAKCRLVNRYKRWVTHEVLPSIRKHGAYATPQTIESIIADPRNGIKLLEALAAEQDKNKALQAENAAMQPKAFFADAVTQSKTSVLVGVLAKLLKQNGYETGQNRLFKTLCNDGYLIGTKGRNYHMPTQRSVEMGLFEVKESTRTHSDGHTSIDRTTLVTGKGQVYFINRYCEQVITHA